MPRGPLMKRLSSYFHKESSHVLGVMRTTLIVLDAAQIPIAHHAIHLTIKLIDLVQTLQESREECAELVTRAGNIIVNVHDQLKPLFLLLGDNSGSAHQLIGSMSDNVQKLVIVLEHIRDVLTTHMSKSFWQRFWSKHLICEDVKRLSTMLKDAHDDFIRGIGLVSASAGIMLVAASNHIHGNTSSGEDQTDGIILKWTDVDLQEDLMAPDTDSCNFWSGTAVARVHDRAVLVKRYIGDDRDAKIKNFLCDLEYLKRARHSNLPRLYGFSRTASEVPFVVIETVAIMPPRQYLEVSPPTITGFWCLLLDVYSAAMFLCRSISSSLDYRSLVEATMLDENGKAIITPERYGSSNKPSRVVNVRVEAQKFAAAVCSSVWSLPMSYPTVSLFKQYQPLGDILGGERRQVDLLHVDRRLIRNPDTAESMILEWQHETLQALNINVLP